MSLHLIAKCMGTGTEFGGQFEHDERHVAQKLIDMWNDSDQVSFPNAQPTPKEQECYWALGGKNCNHWKVKNNNNPGGAWESRSDGLLARSPW